jgi:hypothetical protein
MSYNGNMIPGGGNHSQAHPFRSTPASFADSTLNRPKTSLQELRSFFPAHPWRYWQISGSGCETHVDTHVTVAILPSYNKLWYQALPKFCSLANHHQRDYISPYFRSALVDGMVQAQFKVPTEYSHFLHVRKTLQRGNEKIALHEHDPNDRSTIITFDEMWHDDSAELKECGE